MDTNRVDDRTSRGDRAAVWMRRADVVLNELAAQGLQLGRQMEKATQREVVALSAQLAAVRAREAAWFRLAARHVPGGGSTVRRSLVLAASYRREQARFWRAQSQTWAVQAGTEVCLAAGAPRLGKAGTPGAQVTGGGR
jgi:hypothetical protein